MRIAFQGETGAYSEEAAAAFYPDADMVPYPEFDHVFEALSSGECDRAVVPIENSLHGSVHRNYDLLREHDVTIVAEGKLRIRHQLLGLARASLSDITTVYSHPQALGQCRDFLKKSLPQARVTPAYDTAGAARDVSREGNPAHAAIASRRAAHEYALTVLAENIESNTLNFTRFLALSGRDEPSLLGLAPDTTTGPPKTSLLFAQSENVPGSLFKSLAVFALRDIDLLKIESRPLVGSPGKYIFHLDLAGHAETEAVMNALRHLEEIAAYVTVLGSYVEGPTWDSRPGG
ncbi:MAG: prephenate dehydratase [Bacteroidetes bacterium CG12_big_fil_rev_8_21_14_0_65_60_17]|nr:MAG: prephenate dehydratase [Bacteroidetes bacterium CG12_big_fil_rev_8_21_14_0_65_60_17]